MKKKTKKQQLKEINKRLDRLSNLMKNEKDLEYKKKYSEKINRLYRQKRMCLTKRTYYSFLEASFCSDELRVYSCPFCGHYHLTSSL